MTRVEMIFIGILAVTIVGCAGPSARLSTQTQFRFPQSPNQLADLTPMQLCVRMEMVRDRQIRSKFMTQPRWESWNQRATESELQQRGYSPRYCDAPQVYERLANADREVYNIDTLRVTVVSPEADICASGGIHMIILEGGISPDSSFAMQKLLKQLPHCRDEGGEILYATTVQLKSGGGSLDDGYKLGRSIRKAGAITFIENESSCASSCAVAFLGGKRRVIGHTGKILFHAPYKYGQNAYGKKVIDCKIPRAELREMNDYYIEMVGKEAGDRLFERTMWYCSAEDGWVITGGSAAELFDISTQR
jgi:hypothetical protein